MALFDLTKLVKEIDQLKTDLKTNATIAFATLVFSKETSHTNAHVTDPQVHWVPTLTYERARGQLDAIHDILVSIYGITEANKVLDEAAKNAGYKVSTMQTWSVHAGAQMASHTPSKPQYSNLGGSSSSTTPRRTGSNIVYAGSSSTMHQDPLAMDVAILPHNAVLSDLRRFAPAAKLTTKKVNELIADAIGTKMPDSIEATAYLYVAFGWDTDAIKAINAERSARKLRPFAHDDIFNIAPSNALVGL